MKYSSNSESESADETETSEENNSSEAHNLDGDESVTHESDREDLFQEDPFQTDAQTNLTPTNECLQQSAEKIHRQFEDDGNHLQLFLRGDSKTQVPLRVVVFRQL